MCFFPEFTVASGMSFSVQAKLVYGDNYVPELVGSNKYHSLYSVTSNTLTFSGSSPDMTFPYFSSLS